MGWRESMISVKQAKYVGEYKIELTFSDGAHGVADLSDLVFNDPRPVFQPLRDKAVFKNFSVDYTLNWENEIDLAPEYLYYQAFQNDPARRDLFKQWGYVA
jgi:hypothetical protein